MILIWFTCPMPWNPLFDLGMERFVCNQTMFVSMERRNRVIDAAVLRDVATAVYPNVSVPVSGNDSEQILPLGPLWIAIPQKDSWLVVWNMKFIFPIFPFSWEFHHPNWRTPSFFRGVGWYHQPVFVRGWQPEIQINQLRHTHLVLKGLSATKGTWEKPVVCHIPSEPTILITLKKKPVPGCILYIIIYIYTYLIIYIYMHA